MVIKVALKVSQEYQVESLCEKANMVWWPCLEKLNMKLVGMGKNLGDDFCEICFSYDK